MKVVVVILASFVLLAIQNAVNCNGQANGNVFEADIKENHCRDRSVCVFTCNYFYPKCDKNIYYGNMLPEVSRHMRLTKYEKNMVQGYLDTCILQKFSKEKYYLKTH